MLGIWLSKKGDSEKRNILLAVSVSILLIGLGFATLI